MVCIGRGPRDVELPIVHAEVNEIDIRYNGNNLSQSIYFQWHPWFNHFTLLIEIPIYYSYFRGTFRYSNCYPDAISMISSGNVNIKCLITHRFSIEDSQNAFETAKNFSKSSDNPTNAIKVMIKCGKSWIDQ